MAYTDTRRWRIFIVILVFVLFLLPGVNQADDGTPTTNQGKKWRVGYLQGGAYVDYPDQLRALLTGLMQMGWMEPAELPEQPESIETDYIWQWLSARSSSDFIEFVGDAYWNNGWKQETRIRNQGAIIERLNRGDLDMIIAMGTWAGQDLANDSHSVPTMVMSTSNPVESGIIDSAADSGRSHIHAKVDPLRYIRQLELFHDIIDFQVLGVVYEDTVEGRTYSALSDIETVAGQQGFSIKTCEAPHSGVSERVAAQGVAQCHRQLAPEIDALYITTHHGIDKKYMTELMEPLLQYKVPTWSQRGAEEVEYGALMSSARADFLDVGMFQARVMAAIMHGVLPGEIPQIYHEPKETIAFNLKTAQIIEFNPGLDLLAAADQIYEEIKKYVKHPKVEKQ